MIAVRKKRGDMRLGKDEPQDGKQALCRCEVCGEDCDPAEGTNEGKGWWCAICLCIKEQQQEAPEGGCKFC